jgi:hypothetical protein
LQEQIANVNSREEPCVTRYRRKEQTTVVAIPLALDIDGFTYRKWGGTQRAKPGDWLVKNGDDVYTVDADTFQQTYRQVGQGLYEKTANVWAERVDVSGTVRTKEGSTDYSPGDYLVSNSPDKSDCYAVSAEKFKQLYEPLG